MIQPPDAPPPARILVVDDDLHTRELLRELCESQGHTVEVAADGPAALDKIKSFNPELVLLDVMIPLIDGFGVLARLRADPATAQLPVVVLTAVTDLEGKIRGIELGADDFITKPFRLFELTTRVRAVLIARAYRARLQAAEDELAGLRTGEDLGDAGDGLGGAGGYAQLRAALAYELARNKRYHRSLAIVLITVDNFDALRSELARSEIDAFTGSITRTLRQSLRETDRLFRLDLDELVAILPETDAAGAERARVRALSALHAHREDLVVAAGVGLVSDEGAASPEDLMRAAQRDLEGRRTPLP